MSTAPGNTESAPTAASRPPRWQAPNVRLSDLALGIPAVLILLVMAGTLYAGVRRSTMATEYSEEAERLIKAGDMKSALVAYKRLASLTPERANVRFGLAMCYAANNDVGRAESLMRSLAPPDKPGYPPAQLWLAQQILASPGLSVPRLELAALYLKRFLDAQPSEPAVKILLGNLYTSLGRLKEARPLLEAAADGRPEILINLANVCRNMGDEDEAKRRAKEALEACKAQAPKYKDDPNFRLLWATSHTLLGEFPQALEILEKTKMTEKLEPVMRRNKATLFVAWDEQLESANADPARRLETLEKGLECDPTLPALYIRLGTLMSGTGEVPARIRARLAAMEKQKSAPGLVELTLGNDAWSREEVPQARAHWEKALAEKPDLAIAANNLAWSLAFKEPTDPVKALRLIDGALKVVPGEPTFRGTRGQILTRLGRWKEAIDDLESAISASKGSKAIHAALADAYQNLGMKNQADEHRRLSL
ncbi:MAG: tetratricopeptide repeat protein [Isosphaeraceae bacterium]